MSVRSAASICCSFSDLRAATTPSKSPGQAWGKSVRIIVPRAVLSWLFRRGGAATRACSMLCLSAARSLAAMGTVPRSASAAQERVTLFLRYTAAACRTDESDVDTTTSCITALNIPSCTSSCKSSTRCSQKTDRPHKAQGKNKKRQSVRVGLSCSPFSARARLLCARSDQR
jgi:hypothetical protein